MKMGELAGIRELAPVVADYVLPRFIVPPIGERDGAQEQLFQSAHAVPDVGGLLARHWVLRRAFIDVTFLIDERGRDSLTTWLPEMFARARSLNVDAIPFARLSDLNDGAIEGFKLAIAETDDLKFGIGVLSGEMVGSDFSSRLTSALEQLGAQVTDCAVFADFSDADFSDPDLVAPIIGGALEALQEIGLWQHIVFQGTNYPETNPAAPGTTLVWPRNEWIAWCKAVKFDPTTAEQMIFGDHAADCAKMVFDKHRAAPIPHYRYTIENDWLIVRGAKSGSDKTIMRDVCNRILESGYFAGSAFSSADAYIEDTARSLDGPGNSTTWRQVNTTHHITRVVFDVAKVRGITIPGRAAEPIGSQLSFKL
jgi:hypothetical protein